VLRKCYGSVTGLTWNELIFKQLGVQIEDGDDDVFHIILSIYTAER